MRYIFFGLFSLMLFSCSKTTRFEYLDPAKTGVDFSNTITESDSFNVMIYEYIYNGAGVGIGDLNNDGLQDIVFAGNQVSPRVYLNLGNFKFRDITSNFKGLTNNQWFSGVTIVDINNDRLADVYITSTKDSLPGRCLNRLWVNMGIDDKGEPFFEEKAKEYGIAFDGESVQSAFLDYDLDGDIDLYIMNNTLNSRMDAAYRVKITDGSAMNNDKLFRNNGNGTFTDVTIAAGIVYEGFGLGIAVGDVNKDGYPDLYISNDFISNDLHKKGRPSPAFPFGQTDKEEGEGRPQGDESRIVEGNERMAAVLLQNEHRKEEAQKSEGDIDEKDITPVHVVDEPSPQDRTDGGSQHHHDAEKAEGLGPLRSRKGLRDDREAQGHHDPSPHRLKDPEDNHQVQIGRDPGKKGGGHKEHDGAKIEVLDPEDGPQPGTRQRTHRKGHGIGGDDPPDFVLIGIEAPDHVGEGHIHNGRIENRKEEREHDHSQRPPSIVGGVPHQASGLVGHHGEPSRMWMRISVESPGRRTTSLASSMEILTGTRWVTLTKVPEAFSGGRREMAAAEVGRIWKTCPWNFRPG